ncbi:MAG: FAD-dependent oxidoreductase [Planctomycetota bacterium]
MTADAAPLTPSVLRQAQHPRHVLVVGAGPTGLFAAKTLIDAGVGVTILEAADRVGGLAAAHVGGANTFEFGVHHLHAMDPFVFGEVQQLVGDRLHPVEKSALIRYGNGFARYPLKFWNIVGAMGPLQLVRCVGGLGLQQVRNRLVSREPADGEEALRQLYGAPLYRTFFEDFTTRYWGLPPRELSAEFIKKKMPRLSAFDGLRKALAKVGVKDRRHLGVESATARETLWYTPTGANEIYGALQAYVVAQGAKLHLEAPLLELRSQHGVVQQAVAGNGHVVNDIDAVISTIPLPCLVRSLRPTAPSQVDRAAAALTYKPLGVFGLLVNKPRVLDALYVYFRDRIYHRISEPTASGMEVTPAGHTILVVELTEQVAPDDEKRQREVFEELRGDLLRDGLIHDPGEIVEHHFFWHRYAYPIYRQGFDEHLAVVREHLAGLTNLTTTGRQGGFVYPNMHQAMRLGHDAALQLLPTPLAS